MTNSKMIHAKSVNQRKCMLLIQQYMADLLEFFNNNKKTLKKLFVCKQF